MHKVIGADLLGDCATGGAIRGGGRLWRFRAGVPRYLLASDMPDELPSLQNAVDAPAVPGALTISVAPMPRAYLSCTQATSNRRAATLRVPADP